LNKDKLLDSEDTHDPELLSGAIFPGSFLQKSEPKIEEESPRIEEESPRIEEEEK